MNEASKKWVKSPDMSADREFVRGTSEMPENLVPPSKAPTTPPPVRRGRETSVDSILAMLAETRSEVIRLRELAEITGARVEELRMRANPR